ncbi:MAG: helix-turn-helix domain-containing protein [Gammaproteobacteria bacterium]
MQETAADKAGNGTGGRLGATLRAAREARNLPIHKAAQDLHLGDEILLALESDDYRTLGAPIFVRGHLRNYARLLDLSEDEVLAEYEHATSRLAPPPLIPQQPGGSTFTRRVGMPVFSGAVFVVLVVLAVTWWEHRPTGQAAGELVQANSTSAMKPAAIAPALAATLEPGSSVSGNEVRKKTPSSSKPEMAMAHKAVPVSGVAVQSAPKTETTPRVAARVVSGQTPAAVPAGSVLPSQLMHVKFVVNQASWIEVYDAAGKRLYYDLAPAGDSLNISGAGPLQVFLGNSPGVSIEMNGAPFNQAPFTRPDNTARFKLSETDSNNGQAG